MDFKCKVALVVAAVVATALFIGLLAGLLKTPSASDIACNLKRQPFVYTAASGVILSPNYPKYPDNSDDKYTECRWLITAPEKILVSVRFEDFELYSFDTVRIYDGSSALSPLIVSLARGAQVSNNYTSTQRYLLLRFTGSYHYNPTARGFKATYSLISFGSLPGTVTSSSSKGLKTGVIVLSILLYLAIATTVAVWIVNKKPFKVHPYAARIDQFPDNWTATGRNEYKKVRLSREDDKSEFEEIKKNCMQAADGRRPAIKEIFRIENTDLYSCFVALRYVMLNRQGNYVTYTPDERMLWHGTPADTADSICQDGFNRTYHGRHGINNGKGTYFAVKSSIAANYTLPTDGKGRKYMFQCRVIVGQFTNGQLGLNEPPKLPGQTAQRYDSVVDDVNNPNYFVVFKDAQAYPEYLIVFE